MERSDIIRTLLTLAPHDHVVLFYSDVQAKRELVFPIVQDALEAGGIAAYLASHETTNEASEAMRRWRIDVGRYETAGSLVIADYQSVAMTDGKLDGSKYTEFLRGLVKRHGLVRVVADATLLIQRGMVDDIIAKEHALGRRIELPLVMVCAYQESVVEAKEGAFLVEMLRTHSHATFPGIALLLT